MRKKIQTFIKSEQGETFKNFVFGFQDGLITTYVLLIGMAMLIFINNNLLLITLLTEIIAGALSMAFGAYISSKTKIEYLEHEKQTDSNLISYLELNKTEAAILDNFANMHPKIWEKIDSRNSDKGEKDPINNAFLMGFAFILGGLIPTFPYFFPVPFWSFIISSILSFLGLFMIGIFRSFYGQKHWIRPAGEMIAIGIIAVIIINVYLFFMSMTYGLFLNI